MVVRECSLTLYNSCKCCLDICILPQLFHPAIFTQTRFIWMNNDFYLTFFDKYSAVFPPVPSIPQIPVIDSQIPVQGQRTMRISVKDRRKSQKRAQRDIPRSSQSCDRVICFCVLSLPRKRCCLAADRSIDRSTMAITLVSSCLHTATVTTAEFEMPPSTFGHVLEKAIFRLIPFVAASKARLLYLPQTLVSSEKRREIEKLCGYCFIF